MAGKKLRQLAFAVFFILPILFCNQENLLAQSSSIPFPQPSPETEKLLELITVTREPITEEIVSIHFHDLPQAQYAGFIIALEKGFYEEAGLPNIVLQWPDSPDNPDNLILSAQSPFCVQGLATSIKNKELGSDLVRIAQLFQRSDYVIVTMAKSGIKQPSGLNNKIMQASFGEALINLNMFLSKQKITPKAIYPIGQNPTPFLDGIVDACMLKYFDGYDRLIQRAILPEELVTFRLFEYGLDFAGEGIDTTLGYYNNNPIVCQAVVEATLKGYYYAFTHKDEAVDSILNYSLRHMVSTNRPHQSWMLDAIYQVLAYKVGPDPRNWGYLNEADYGLVTDYILGTNANTRPEINLFYSPPHRDWPAEKIELKEASK